MKKKTRLKGLKNIHFAPFTGTFATPTHLVGAKKLESTLNYELEQRESDDVIDEQEYIFKGGEGSVALKSLTPEEYKILFGNESFDTLVAVRTTDNAPQGALLFERRFTGSSYKRLYCIFNVKFAPTSITAESCGDGTKEIDEELEFAVGEFGENLAYVFVDTDTEDTDIRAIITKWYTAVPTEEEINTILAKASAVNINTKKK